MGSQYMPQIERGTGIDFTNAGTITGLSGGGLPPLPPTNIWIGNGGGVATAHPISGDSTLAVNGALTNALASNLRLSPPGGTIEPFVINPGVNLTSDLDIASFGVDSTDTSLHCHPYFTNATFPAAQAIPTGAGGATIIWGTAPTLVFQDSPPGAALMWTAGSPTDFVVQNIGFHQISVFVSLDPSVAPVSRLAGMQIRRGLTIIAQADAQIQSLFAGTMSLSVVDNQASVGDIYTVVVFQFSGGNLNINGGTYESGISVIRLY